MRYLKGIVDGWKQVKMAAYLHGLDMKMPYSKYSGFWSALRPVYQRPNLKTFAYGPYDPKEVLEYIFSVFDILKKVDKL
jgi:hypothetical protein